MNIEQAKQRISELTPIHDAAWKGVEQAQQKEKLAEAEWLPIYNELKNLKLFIEISESN